MSDGKPNRPRLDDERLLALVDSYLAGDADRGDVELIRQWLADDPEFARLVEDLRRIRDAIRVRPRFLAPGDAWNRFRAGLPADVSGAVLPRSPHRSAPLPRPLSAWSRRQSDGRRRSWGTGVAVAAGLALLVAAGSFVSRRWPPASGASDDALKTFATSLGQRAEILLADGSHVSLAPNSELVVASAFADSSAREVRLRGEAYFNVVHDERRPFTVRAGNAVIHDLGTRFAVRSYEVDTSVRVVVTEGQVRVQPTASSRIDAALLEPTMLAHVGASGAVTVQSGVDTTFYVAFTRGRLVFANTPVREAIRELERWYDIDVKLSDPRMGDRRITGTIVEQTLPTALEQLSTALDVHVSRAGRTVTLSVPRNRRF